MTFLFASGYEYFDASSLGLHISEVSFIMFE